MTRAWWLVPALGALLAGCKSQPGGVQGPTPVPRGKPPAYSAVAAAYNQRVEPISRLWSRATVRVWFPDREQEGKEEQAQVDANLQYMQPNQVNLTLSHVGKSDPIAVLGSDERRYWFIDLQRKPGVVYLGEHQKATPDRIARLDIPVHPLDLIELMGLTPLPTSWPSVGTGEAPDLKWSPDGRALILTMPGRSGRRRLHLDPDTYRPMRVELTGPGGAVVVSAELSRYMNVEGSPEATIPGELLASVDEGRRRLRLRPDLPSLSRRIHPAAFDLELLLERYGVKERVDLDEPRAAAPQPVGLR